MASAEVLEKYFSSHRTRIRERKILIDLLTVTKPVHEITINVYLTADQIKGMLRGNIEQVRVLPDGDTSDRHLVAGDVIIINNTVGGIHTFLGKGYVDKVDEDSNDILILDIGLFSITDKAVDIYDKFTLKSKLIDNYKGDPVITTVGRYMTNYMILVYAFGDKIPYVNGPWKMGDIENKISSGLLDKSITKLEYDKFVDACYYLGHFTELCVPTLTKKSFMTDPKVTEVKAELIKKYKGRLKDPEVIKIIEDTLLKMDKDYLKGDVSTRFYDAIGSKAYNIHRKKLFLSVGGIPAFEESGGKYDFIENSLAEGWNADNFANLSNESRKGSYDRGKNTAKGGALTKFIMRVFQDLSIIEEDCGSRKGITITLTGDNLSMFEGRNILVGSKLITLDEKTLPLFIGKTVKVRSPLYCLTKNGLCYTCVGETFRSLSTEALGMLVVDISSTFLTLSLKNMHGSKLDFVAINPNEYLVQQL